MIGPVEERNGRGPVMKNVLSKEKHLKNARAMIVRFIL